MTARQITKALETAGINTAKYLEIRKGEVEIWTGNRNSSERLMRKVAKALKWGGHSTGWGGWVLQEAYRSDPYEGKSSRIHY